jgi:hypothetical protein
MRILEMVEAIARQANADGGPEFLSLPGAVRDPCAFAPPGEDPHWRPAHNCEFPELWLLRTFGGPR